jgi:hypothetical protein
MLQKQHLFLLAIDSIFATVAARPTASPNATVTISEYVQAKLQ